MPITAYRDPNAPERIEVALERIDGTREVDGRLYEVVRVDPQILGFAPDMDARIEALGLTRLGPGVDHRWTEYGRPVKDPGRAPVEGRYPPSQSQHPEPAETAVADSAAQAAEGDEPTSRGADNPAPAPSAADLADAREAPGHRGHPAPKAPAPRAAAAAARQEVRDEPTPAPTKGKKPAEGKTPDKTP